jgi:hypothetical protein
VTVFFAVYGPAVGRGFISDDFGWITQSRIESFGGALRLFDQNHGFYRPLVALSWALNYAFAGASPLTYGWTNLLLALIAAILIMSLLGALRLSRAAAAFGAAVWLLNFHGINMALLWISGRTALLLIVGALVGTIGVLRGRASLALAGLACALLSKEEALAIPLIWIMLYALRLAPPSSRRGAMVLSAGTLCAVLGYFFLRAHAGAVTVATAPPFYRPTFAPAVVARNVLEYADRACSFAAASSLLAWLTLRPRSFHARMQIFLLGAVWIAAGYALTVWLPSRSSLYACFPSIGAAMIAAEFVAACWRGSVQHVRREWTLVVLVLVAVICAPAYVARNHRWTDLADLSSAVVKDIASAAPAWPDDTWLVLVDDRSRRVNLQSAFGALIDQAVTLYTERPFHVWVEPPLTYAALVGMRPPCDQCPTVRLFLRNGHLVPR